MLSGDVLFVVIVLFIVGYRDFLADFALLLFIFNFTFLWRFLFTAFFDLDINLLFLDFFNCLRRCLVDLNDRIGL